METLTDQEKMTKKGWLIILIATLLLSASVFFGLLGSKKILDIPLTWRLVNLGMGIAFAYLYYALCYRRTTTFLLTLSLASFWIGLLVNAIVLLKGSLSIDLFLILSSCIGVVNYIFTRRLRHLNKALKEYSKFPEESKEVIAWIQRAESQEDLHKLFSEGLEKWPRLKWVLRREKAIKESTCF